MRKLNKPVLMLNRFWKAINVIRAKEAVVCVSAERGKIIDPEFFDLHTFPEWIKRGVTKNPCFVSSSSTKFDIPEVITVCGYDKVPDTKVAMTRRNIYIRDNYQCQYCGKSPGTEELSIDHIVPRSQGGKTTWKNCVIACTECNWEKGGRTPKKAGMSLRNRPVCPEWNLKYVGGNYSTVPNSWSEFVDTAYWNVEIDE